MEENTIALYSLLVSGGMLVIALIAVFHGPRVSANAASKIALAQIQLHWLNDLISILTEISTVSADIYVISATRKVGEKGNKIIHLTNQLGLMLDFDNEEHANLMDHCENLSKMAVVLFDDREKKREAYLDADKEFVMLSRKLVKAERSKV